MSYSLLSLSRESSYQSPKEGGKLSSSRLRLCRDSYLHRAGVLPIYDEVDVSVRVSALHLASGLVSVSAFLRGLGGLVVVVAGSSDISYCLVVLHLSSLPIPNRHAQYK